MNIVLASDDNGVNMLAVTLYSVIRNNPGVQLDFHIIHSKITEDNQKRLLELDKVYENVSVLFHFIDAHFFDDISLNRKTITMEAFYRYLIVDLLPNEDKAIYIDIDMLNLGQLSDLYKMDLSGYSLAAVEDYLIMHDKGWYGFRHATKFIKDKYFNSGFMVLNLKQLRQKGEIDKFWENSRNKSKLIDAEYNVFADQTVANITFRNKVLFLPYKYNTLLTALHFIKPRNVIIAHFTGWAKPLSYREPETIKYDSLYLEYYIETMKIIGDDGAMLRRVFLSLEDNVRLSREEKHRAIDERNSVRKELEEVLSSTSWRITKPLRDTVKILRQVIRSIK